MIWADGRIDGRRINKSTHLLDWDEAQSLIRQWNQTRTFEAALPKATATLAQSVQSAEGEESLSLDQAWDRFEDHIERQNLSSTTIYKYALLRRQMDTFARKRGVSLIRDFNRDVLEAFQSEWMESPVTRSKKLERLKAFFRDAVGRAGLEKNPASLLKPPKIKPRPTLPFSRAEMEKIIAAIERYPNKSGKIGQSNGLRLHALVLTLRYSGLRIGDVTRLHVAKLDGVRIFLYTQKTGVPAYCVLPQFVADALATVPRLSESYFFWTGESKLHTAVGTWQRTLRKLFKRAGIIGGHAHRFRDTFSVELLLSGVPIEDVSVLLGHRNIKTTLDHYAPWSRERQLRLEAQLNRAWSSDPIVLLQEAIRDETQRLTLKAPN